MRARRIAVGLVITVMIGFVSHLATRTQAQQQAIAPTRIEFQVVESLDAAYLGDTPGHRGRAGGLGQAAPRAALGDDVMRGDQRVGRVTHLTLDRSKESLDVEFDPEPKIRIGIGDLVWIRPESDGPR
jgi:hypothetical protein